MLSSVIITFMLPLLFSDYALVPDLGQGKVLDSVHYLLHFALDLLTVGKIDEVVNSEYINGLEWYCALSGTLDGKADDSIEGMYGLLLQFDMVALWPGLLVLYLFALRSRGGRVLKRSLELRVT